MSSKSQPETKEAPSAGTLEASNVDQTTTKGDNMNSNIATESSQLPVIAGHEITTDEHGRFSLNAIHKASGEGEHKRPSKWTVTAQAKELIEELESQSPKSGFAAIGSKHGGSSRGTYAHELLAVSYAGWISARFQLQVNQVFLDYRMGRLRVAEGESQKALPSPLTPDHQRGIQKAVARRAQALPKGLQRVAYARLYGHLKDRFGVAKYDQIPDEQYTQALAAIETCELDGEWLPAHEQVAEQGLSLTDTQAQNMLAALSHLLDINRIYEQYSLYEHLTGLGSPAGIKLHDHIKDGRLIARHLISKLENELLLVRARLGLPYRSLLN